MNETRDVSHDETIIAMLKADPDFANEYLSASLDEVDLKGGRSALLSAMRHIAQAQGVSAVAERAGIPRESLYRALGANGNPTITTFLALIHAVGLRLDVSQRTITAA